MSKLDILARYAAPQKKTKKGTKPLKTALIVVDDNEEDVVLSSEAVEDRWDRDLTEDAPVVEDVSRGYSRKGDWESVEVRAVAEPSPPRRRKLSDASDSPPRRRAAPLSISAPVRKMDEDSSPRRRQEDESPPRRPQSSPSPPRRKRFEAPSQPINAGSSSPPRNPKEVAKEKVDGGRLTMTASGHAAGLQSGERFGETERSIKSLRDVELASADPEKSGGKAETVYRDRSGKKVDALDNFMRKQAAKEGKVSSSYCRNFCLTIAITKV